MKKVFVLLSLSSLFLIGCNSNNQSSTSGNQSTSPNDEPQIEVNSLKTGLFALSNTKNYLVKRESDNDIFSSLYFTKDYICYGRGEDGASFHAYVNDNQGIYPLDIIDEDVKSGEYYLNEEGSKYKDVWSNELIQTPFGLDISFADYLYDDDYLLLESKIYKLNILKSFGIGEKNYLNLDSMNVRYQDKSLIFTANFTNRVSYYFTVSNFGSTSNNDVKKFIDNGGTAFVPSESHELARELLLTDNFSHSVYDFESKGYKINEMFHPHYFYSYSFASPTSINGYMAMNQKANENHPDLDLYGCYMFYTNTNGNFSFNPNAFYTKPNIPEFFHYPRYMKLLKNLQFIKEGSIQEVTTYLTNSEKYYVDDQTLIRDFATNMSLDQSFNLDDYPPQKLGIEYSFNSDDKKTQIIFHYILEFQGNSYDYLIPFTNFGGVNHQKLNQIYDTYND